MANEPFCWPIRRLWAAAILLMAGTALTFDSDQTDEAQVSVKLTGSDQVVKVARTAELLLGGLYTGPYFDQFTATNISVQVGSTALLPCRVRQAGNRSVSWVRKTDGHLLSVGDDTFISDNRFQAQRIQASDTWTLQIRSVQNNDSGDYECQVSSNEPKISRIVHLRTVEPQVSIKGAPDMYVKNGSPVTLQCHISSFLQSPAYVDWLLNGTMLIHVKNHPYAPRVATTAEGNNNWIVAAASDGSGGASNGDAGRSAVLERIGNDTLLLTLFLPSVSPEDSGQYSCSPANAAPARISFHVVTGEHPAAMQHGDNGSSSMAGSFPPSSRHLTVVAFIILLIQHIHWRHCSCRLQTASSLAHL